MAVKVRLKRCGRKNRPLYRICVFDSRTRRDGTPIEELGCYDPAGATWEQKVTLDAERALHWLDVGAQPSETVASFLKRRGLKRGQPLPTASPAASPAATDTGADAESPGESAE
jgi:small subunit ribosomal protein S16